MHMMGYGLTMAINMGRIYIHGAGAEAWTQGNTFCHPARLLDECFLMPMSSCSLNDILNGEPAPFLHQIVSTAWPEHRVLQVETDANGASASIPDVFHHLLANGPIPLGNEQYGSPSCALPYPGVRGWSIQWWRAQATAYVYRLNPRTLHMIAEHTKKIFQPFNGTIPPGTINVHVRRGDKEKETTDITDAEYLATVEALFTASNAAGVPLQRTVFVSTEDNATLAVVKAWPGWNVLSTDVPRYHEKISPMDFAARMGVTDVILNDLVSLELALQCDAWVGSLSSNWVRLIHELRATARCKADHLFSDSRYGLNFTYTNIPYLW